MMKRQFTATELRRWASQCERSAKDITMSAGDRERLLRMKVALVELARTTEWLDGKSERVCVDFIAPDDRPAGPDEPPA